MRDFASRYWRWLVASLGVVLIVFGFVVFFPPKSEEVEIIPAQKEEKEFILTDIEGAVVKPGVYQLKNGSRINDLLIACGGLSLVADRDWVEKSLNKAALLIDGQKIYIPQKGEASNQVLGSGLVSLNQAEANLLETLPGIGPSMAEKIIDYREKNGGFKSIEELMAVPGIGPKTFAKIKDKISL